MHWLFRLAHSGVAGGGGNNTGTGGTGGTGGAGCTGPAQPLCPSTGGSPPAPPACSSNPSDYQYRFQDPCAPIEERITDLLAQMTPEEKLGLMSEYQLPVDRLGIRAFTTFTEGLHGVGWASDGRKQRSLPDRHAVPAGVRARRSRGIRTR